MIADALCNCHGMFPLERLLCFRLPREATAAYLYWNQILRTDGRNLCRTNLMKRK